MIIVPPSVTSSPGDPASLPELTMNCRTPMSRSTVSVAPAAATVPPLRSSRVLIMPRFGSISSVPPGTTLTGLLASADWLPRRSVPACTTLVPDTRLALASTSVPSPSFVIPRVPRISDSIRAEAPAATVTCEIALVLKLTALAGSNEPMISVPLVSV